MTNRRLETLALLQAHPGISATQLAARLGVTYGTARRDVAHLRVLGYHIDAEAGRASGYRIASGRTMPPLLLDADEVAAVAVGLRTAIAVEGLDAAATTALAKLTQVVPARWRTRLTALADVQAPPGSSRRRAGRDVLIRAALACRADEAIHFGTAATTSPTARRPRYSRTGSPPTSTSTSSNRPHSPTGYTHSAAGCSTDTE